MSSSQWLASVEAIFITQNRMAAAADKRADLDLQISLLAEHEVTKLTSLVASTAEKIGIESPLKDELPEIERDVSPEQVLEELEKWHQN